MLFLDVVVFLYVAKCVIGHGSQRHGIMCPVLNLKTENIKLHTVRHLLYNISVSGNRFIVTFRLDSSRNISVHLSKFIRLKHLSAIKDSSIEKICKMFIITPESLKCDIFLVSSAVCIIHMSPFFKFLYVRYSENIK